MPNIKKKEIIIIITAKSYDPLLLSIVDVCWGPGYTCRVCGQDNEILYAEIGYSTDIEYTYGYWNLEVLPVPLCACYEIASTKILF